MNTLICDSGGTKSAWLLMDADGKVLGQFQTDGMNPAVNSHDAIMRTLSSLNDKMAVETVSEVWFYGAGCVHGTAEAMESMIRDVVPATTVHINSDMLGAARALCGTSEGIACILGTGANSCYYDGKSICQNTPSLGYILGDEGGGAVLGRILVNRLYKGLFPDYLRRAFEQEMNTSLNTIIERVYRMPGANRYLASFTYFIAAHRSDSSIHDLLTHCFGQFFRRNILTYNRLDLPVNFVGGLAYNFYDELLETSKAEGFTLGRIIPSPIVDLARFHASNRKTLE